jgi:hypothetical protein
LLIRTGFATYQSGFSIGWEAPSGMLFRRSRLARNLGESGNIWVISVNW